MESLEEWLTQPRGVAVRLRELRARAGLSGKDLADRAGPPKWAQSKVSRIEHGKQVPTKTDIDTWADITGASDEDRATLHRLREDAQVAHFQFRDRMRHGQAPVQADYTRLVEQSTLIRHVDTVWVPGLLQVPGYARRVFEEMIRLGNTDTDDVDAAVATRMERQRFLYDPGKRFEFLMTEAVLRWLLVPPAVMRAQLDRLLSATALDRVRVGVIPFGAELPWSPLDTYQVYAGEETVVMVETLVEDAPHRGEDADRFSVFADRLWEEAAEGKAARRIILDAQAALPG